MNWGPRKEQRCPCCWGAEDGAHPDTAHLCPSNLEEFGPNKRAEFSCYKKVQQFREGSWAKAIIYPVTGVHCGRTCRGKRLNPFMCKKPYSQPLCGLFKMMKQRRGQPWSQEGNEEIYWISSSDQTLFGTNGLLEDPEGLTKLCICTNV